MEDSFFNWRYFLPTEGTFATWQGKLKFYCRYLLITYSKGTMVPTLVPTMKPPLKSRTDSLLCDHSCYNRHTSYVPVHVDVSAETLGLGGKSNGGGGHTKSGHQDPGNLTYLGVF
jgi:hypothetical protein